MHRSASGQIPRPLDELGLMLVYGFQQFGDLFGRCFARSRKDHHDVETVAQAEFNAASDCSPHAPVSIMGKNEGARPPGFSNGVVRGSVIDHKNAIYRAAWNRTNNGTDAPGLVPDGGHA